MEKKKTLYSSDKLKSHPDKFLEKHLLSVGSLCQEIVSSKKLNLDNYIDFKTIQDISYLIGITHDCGKATSFYQGIKHAVGIIQKTVKFIFCRVSTSPLEFKPFRNNKT